MSKEHFLLSDSARKILAACALSIWRTFPHNALLYGVAVAMLGSTQIFLSHHNMTMSPEAAFAFLKMAGTWMLLWIVALPAVDLFHFWRNGAPSGVASLISRRMIARLLDNDRIGNAVHALVILSPLLIAFTALKEDIAIIHPFSWDATFAHWDRILGMGRMPWEMLQPFLGFPAITITINFCYDAWFIAMFGILLWQIFSVAQATLRLQFLLSFALAWFFGGSVLAMIFSSAGPCFYDYLFPGGSPYTAQMAYLHGIGGDWVWSLAVQDELWRAYTTGVGKFRGISAMPSMHVTIAVLLAIFGWRKNRGLGLALTTFTAVVLVGSVHLAWHYTVDGLAAIVVAFACWAAAGLMVRRWLQFLERRYTRGRYIPVLEEAKASLEAATFHQIS
jgi:hypothetical protein